MGKIVEKRQMICMLSVLAMTVVVVTLTLCLVFLLDPNARNDETICYDECKFTLVETISQNLTYDEGSPVHMETYPCFSHLLDIAQSNINLGSYYWSMRAEDVPETSDPSSAPGVDIFNRLMSIGQQGDVKIQIVQNDDTQNNPGWMVDTQMLQEAGAADLRIMNFPKLFGKTGIQHAKMWVVDDKHFYVGSANFDWRALTQVKELGLMVENCGCLGRDIQKTFDAFWLSVEEGHTITDWPAYMETKINMDHPILLQNGGLNETAYITVSPPQLQSPGRSSDLDAVLRIIDHAQEFIYIALMDYFPLTLYKNPNEYWPIIDDRLRAAAFERGVNVRLMPSQWKYSRSDNVYYLNSLEAMSPALREGSIAVKLFEVPEFTEAQANIPYSRVNHNKYMVTETTAFITTSNWSGDYFTDTGAVSMVVSQSKGSVSYEENVHVQLRKIFERDWNSEWAHNVTHFMPK